MNILLSLVAPTISTADATLNTERIDQLTGLTGKRDEKEDAYKIRFPHEDIAVSVDGWEIAFMGLTTWASFTRATHSEAGINIVAIHSIAPAKNRGLFSSIVGAVAELKLAESVQQALPYRAKPYQIVR